MTLVRTVVTLVCCALGCVSWAVTAAPTTPDDPYLKPIIKRNVFGLVPEPAVVKPQPPAPPLPTVRLVGVTTILGDQRALFEVHLPPKPPEAAAEEHCVLATGQSDGPIKLLEIDVRAGRVKIDNSGTVDVAHVR